MKKVIVFVMLVFVVAGCESACKDYRELNTRVTRLINQTTIVQTRVALIIETAIKAGAIDPNDVDDIAELNEEINRVKEQIALILDAYGDIACIDWSADPNQ